MRKGGFDTIIPEFKVLEDIPEDFFNDTISFEPFIPQGVSVEAPEDIEKRATQLFGPDDRQLWNDEVFPNIAVGRMTWANGVFCSGALVGPRHVLTARHCLPNPPQAMRFAPGFDNGERFGSGQVISSYSVPQPTPGTPCGFKSDWGIAILGTRLGDEVGFFGVKLPPSSGSGNHNLMHIGYPGDKDNGQRPCRTAKNPIVDRYAPCDATGPVYSETDNASGQSGGPLWELDADGKQWIWGDLSVQVKYSDGSQASGWGSGNVLMNTLNRARNEYP